MSNKERVGSDVTKSTYIKSDGLHAYYVGGQTYTGAAGETIIERVGGEALHWVTDDKGKRILDAYYNGGWFRISEDNGLHWADYGRKFCFDTKRTEEQILPDGHSLDKKHDILVRLDTGMKADKDCYGHRNQGAYRAFYSISGDGGLTWGEPVQIVDGREGYDAVSWGPGFEYGECGGLMGDCVWLDDGSVVVPFTVYRRLDGSSPWYFRIICARGYWRKDMNGFDWVFGNHFEVPREKSPGGCCEPTVTDLGGDKLFMVTRCQGSEEKGIYSTRYSTLSEDGGMTWSNPAPLVYDDRTNVWTPASYSRFYQSSKTGKTYWLANILDKPVYGQVPRYPLTVAEFDRNKRCIVKKSVRVIQDKPEGAHELVRYTNFGCYEDRKTGNLTITLPEQYRYIGYNDLKKPEDFAADCVKYEVKL